MTFLGNVFTREDTLNPVLKQRQIKGFQTSALQKFTICSILRVSRRLPHYAPEILILVPK